mmetsp:Transcript_3388/g.5703  ORF Transcript_3388/g.5703 Transcript_3388/m.5703 type:complete len:120 (+) Transcript_3388:488-847(+)
MMKLNFYPMALLTKYSIKSFKKQTSRQEGEGRFGLIQLASSASDFPLPFMTIYSATKRYNDIFAQQVAFVLGKKASTETVDTLIVKPGLVTTSMTKNMKLPMLSCFPEETSSGSLHVLG